MSVQTFKRDIKRFHPTQKPVALYEWLIKTYSNEGDLVLDNCSGSGTAGMASINTGRNYIGIELDKEIYRESLDRINSLSNNKDKEH